MCCLYGHYVIWVVRTAHPQFVEDWVFKYRKLPQLSVLNKKAVTVIHKTLYLPLEMLCPLHYHGKLIIYCLYRHYVMCIVSTALGSSISEKAVNYRF